MKILRRVLIAVGLVVGVVLVVVLRPGFTFPIFRQNSVASLEEVDLNGARQWVLIRGQRDKPIVLFLHGGPGMPAMYLAHAFQRPLERDFLVVQWDRRGAGKSLPATTDPSRIRTSQEVADAVALIQLLRQRYGASKVILVGHSYGSYLGITLAQRHPELVRAYVGVGQLACDPAGDAAIQDRWLRAQAAAAGDSSTLSQMGQPGWDRESALFKYGAEVVKWHSFTPMILTGLAAPEYTFGDALNVPKGVAFTHRSYVYDGPSLPLYDSVKALEAPVFMFEGRRDMVTPTDCAARLLSALAAPLKSWTWFERSAHFPFLEEPDHFHQALLDVVRRTSL
ncbi:MAG TPA: alpha/beta hydrolase [Caulobacteraceae bacterium]|nr:alpha/beta hydrolase [Caulobacteraceae bacterium]